MQFFCIFAAQIVVYFMQSPVQIAKYQVLSRNEGEASRLCDVGLSRSAQVPCYEVKG